MTRSLTLETGWGFVGERHQDMSKELLIDTRAAVDVWIELHKTIREAKEREDMDGVIPPDVLTYQERQLYDALTQRLNNGLGQ